MSSKKTSELVKNNPDAVIWFFDEARCGNQPCLGRMWGIKGIRRIVKVKIGYENFYVYSAVCPATGEDFTLLLPYVNTRVMNRSLAEFGTWLEGRKCILVMDQAGWHCSKELRVPSNVEIAHLPPYSPELNPVERLWDWLKRNAIRNRFFDTLVEIMDAADEQIRMLTPEILKSMCACEYLAH